MHRLIKACSCVLLLCAVQLAPVAGARAATSSAEGWRILYLGRTGAARAAFRSVLARRPADPDALRGMAMAYTMDGCEHDAARAWVKLCTAAPAHWSVYAYWPRIVEVAASTGQRALLDEAARGIAAGRGVPLALAATARATLSAAAERRGNLAEAERLNDLGQIGSWQGIGPFDNTAGSGFGRIFPPERRVALKEMYPGTDQVPVGWHPLRLAVGSWCEVGASLSESPSGVFYATTAVYSPDGGPAVLGWDPRGASKVYLNGNLVVADPIYRRSPTWTYDPYRLPVTLRAGWNTLLVKVVAEDYAAAFGLRVTRPSGETLEGMQVSPLKADGTNVCSEGAPAPSPADAGPAQRLEPDVAALLRERIRKGDVEAGDALANWLSLTGDDAGCVELRRWTVERIPQSAWLRLLLSLALTDDPEAAKAEWERCRKITPRPFVVTVHALGAGPEEVQPSVTIKRAKRLMAANPGAISLYFTLVAAYDAADKEAEADKCARLAVRNAPSAGKYVWLIGRYLRRRQDAQASRLLAEGLQRHPDDSELLWYRAHLLVKKGKKRDAVAAYADVLDADRTLRQYWISAAHLCNEVGDRKRAEKLLREAGALFPQDAELRFLLGKLLSRTGRKKDAIALHQAAIRLDPGQSEARSELRRLTGTRPELDMVPPLPVEKLLAKTPTAADLPGVPAVMLLDEARQVVRPDFSMEVQRHQIVKLLTDAGAEASNYMGVNEEDPALTLTMQKATLIRAKGKKEDMKTLSFFADPPAAGDTIDMTFRVEGHRGGTLARQVWRTWMFDRLKIPVTLSRYVLMTPLDLEPRVLTHGTAPQADVKTLGNWRIREWRTEDTPALRKDTGSPAVFDCGSWLEVSTTDSWATIARWYRDLSRPRCEPDAVVRAKAAELTKGLSTPDEKIAALVRFVSRKVAYHSGPLWRSPYIPEEGRFVLQRGAGDCKDKAALLTALLASQGIRAQMALVNPRSEGITRHLPSICFVHAITRIEAPQGPLWVDATDAKADFGYLPDEDQEVPALIADDATTDLVMTPAMPPDRRGLVETHTGTVGSDGSLTATAQIEYLGGEATRTRDWLDEASPDQRDEALRELLTEIAPNARYESGTAADLDALDKPAVLRLSYKVFRHTQDAGDLLLLRPPGLDLYGSTLKAFPADPARKQDLETAKIRGRFVRRVTLGIPAGWAARDLPPEVAGTSPWGSYRVTYRVENGTLHVEADARVLPLRVPAADIPRFAEFLSALDHEARRHVLFRKP